jgi:hypothetical protein
MFSNQERLKLRSALDQAWTEFTLGSMKKPLALVRLDVLLTTPREVWTRVGKQDLDAVAAFARLAAQELMVRVAERKEAEEESKS